MATVHQTFSWEVTNPAPTATNDDFTIAESGTVNANAITDDNGNGADSDPDLDVLAVTEVNASAANVGAPTAGTGGGQFTLNSDGTFVFAAGSDFDQLSVGESATTSINYTISDGQGGTDTATITVTVTGTNSAPTTLGTIPPQVGTDGAVVAPLDITAFFDEADASDTLTYSDAGTLPPGLTLDPNTGIINGTVTPSASTTGPYTVQISATDQSGDTAVQTFTWTIDNPGPVATDDNFTTAQTTALAGNLVTDDNGSGVDQDSDGDTIVVRGVNGNTANVSTPIAGTNGGVFTVNPDGSYAFDTQADFDNLAAGETRDTQITYTSTDNEGGTSVATVTVTVTGTNDDPFAIGTIPSQNDLDNSTVTPLDVTPYFGETDSTDTLTFDTGTTLPPGLSIDPATGIISGTTDSDASSGGPYVVVVTATDTQGAVITQTFNWNVTDLGPVALDDDFTTNQGGSLGGNVVTVDNGNGVDFDTDGDTITVQSVNGSAANLSSPVAGSTGGIFTVNPDGSYQFSAGSDFDDLGAGEARDTTITYTITDGNSSATATVTVTINGVNDTPTNNGSIPNQTDVDSSTIAPLDVTGFFSDVDATDTLTFSQSGLPTGLTLDSATGIINGTPAANASLGSPYTCLLYTSPSPRDATLSRMPSSA